MTTQRRATKCNDEINSICKGCDKKEYWEFKRGYFSQDECNVCAAEGKKTSSPTGGQSDFNEVPSKRHR